MNEGMPPIGEDDLQAYVDDRLEPSRRAAVAAYLGAAPDEARRIAAYRAQKQAMQQAFAIGEDENPPRRLTLAGIVAERRRPKRTPWLVAASLLLTLGIGVAGGMLMRGPRAPDRTELAMTLLEQEAAASHVVYAADRGHPTEVPGSEKSEMAQWLSDRLKRTVAPPDLSAAGYHLIGGRLLATERGGAAALFMYEDDGGHRLSVLLRPMAPDLHAPMTRTGKDHLAVQAWIAKGLGIAVAASLPAEELSRISADVERGFASAG